MEVIKTYIKGGLIIGAVEPAEAPVEVAADEPEKEQLKRGGRPRKQ